MMQSSLGEQNDEDKLGMNANVTFALLLPS